MRGYNIATGILLVAVTALIVWCFIMMEKVVSDCEARGGEMVGDGTYTTTFIQSGNTFIPIQSENLSCSK